MNIQPYLFFEGRCQEALDFYTKALEAKVPQERLVLTEAQIVALGEATSTRRRTVSLKVNAWLL